MIETPLQQRQTKPATIGPINADKTVTSNSTPTGEVAYPRSPSESFLTSQFHRPRGFFGRVAGWMMSWRRSNRLRNLLLIDLLDLKPDSRVLEIGPGPGLALAAAAREVTTGDLVAIDHSEVMLAQTAARNRDLLSERRLTLIHGDATDLPVDVSGFDFIWAMNVWQFWTDQRSTIADLAARLNPGGTLVIGHQQRGATADVDPGTTRRHLQAQLRAAGLDVEYRVAGLQPPVSYVIGHRG